MIANRFILNAGRLFLTSLVITAILCVPLASRAAQNVVPDLLVLVLNGTGPYDAISISYASDVTDKEAEADLKALAQITHWQVRDAKLTTEATETPGSKPTTSISFETPRVVNGVDGTLPVEPFVNVFKRFSTIRVNYLLSSPFELKGLRDFENKFVRVSLKQVANSYEYTVLVKDDHFDRAGLPAKTEVPIVESKVPEGMSVSKKIILTLGFALLGAMSAYFVAASICKRRQSSR